MLHDDLHELGLADEEIKVYLSVLELGGGFVSSIARKAGVHRVTCYNTLGNLEKKKRDTEYHAKKCTVLLGRTATSIAEPDRGKIPPGTKAPA